MAKQILLIEDSAGDILLIKQVLSQANLPIRLRVAMDGDQALQVFAEPEFKADLIILDLNIPKVSGLELLERCQPQPQPPVVVFSSSSDPTEIKRTKELGVREFVQKPIDFEEFERVVKRIVKDWVTPEVNGAEA